MLFINESLSIPEDEILFEASTSGGPGGQHVNRVQTRVTLSFDLNASSVLTERDRHLILERLASRINKAGVLQVRSERHRSQRMNREDARSRFAELVAEALIPTVDRKRTRVSRGVRARRVDEKRRRSRVKNARRRPQGDED